jgi:hypothetical protein
MKRASRLLICTPLILAAGLCLERGTRAEVAAQLDPEGRYLFTRVTRIGQDQADVWSVRPGMRLALRGVALNPMGDRIGDADPFVAESPVAPHHAWVVWGRYKGQSGDYDLVWSRWLGRRWTVPRTVRIEPDPHGDDLDPQVRMNESGRPFLVWWRNTDGRGQVFFSVFVLGRWTDPLPVSPDAVHATHPSIQAISDDEVVIRYETREGPQTQSVAFSVPVSITDDINPQVRLNGPGGNRLQGP